MQMTRTATNAGWRRLVAVTLALAVALAAALVTSTPAQAADDVTDGELRWGFRENFRNYVGRQTAALPPIGALPPGERITLIGSAQWDLDGTPAWPDSPSDPNETLPYRLEVTGGTFTDEDNLVITTTGGAAYHFPSHAFDVYVQNVTVVVDDGDISLRGDFTVVIPENNLDFEPGTYGGEDVLISGAADGSVAIDGDEVTVTGTGLALTADGAAALQNFLAVGSALDDFSVTATIEEADTGGPGEPGTYEPGDLTDGDALWGISEYLNAGAPGRPNPSPANYGAPSTYDAVTKISTWGDGQGTLAEDGSAELAFAGSSVNHATTGGGWLRLADLEADLDAHGNGTVSAVVSYGTMAPPAVFNPETPPIRGPQRVNLVALGGNDAAPVVDDDTVTWTGLEGVWHDDLLAFLAGDADAEPAIPAWLYASTVTNTGNADRLPAAFTFSLALDTEGPGEPGGDEGDQDIEVTVPEPEPQPGEFVWSIDNSGGPASLGVAEVNGDHLLATGAINPISVTDTRLGGLAWSISAQVSDFTSGSDSFEGRLLGWSPQVVTPGAGAVAGDTVASGFVGGDGLAVARELASASDGHELGTAGLGAGLELRLPLDTAPGDYRATLTVTALS